MIKNRRALSGQASYFHRHKESNNIVTASPEKTWDEVNLLGTTSNTNTTPLDVPEALNLSNNSNTTINFFNIDFDTPSRIQKRKRF